MTNDPAIVCCLTPRAGASSGFVMNLVDAAAVFDRMVAWSGK